MNPFLIDLFKNQDYDKNSFFLIAGPCVVESEALVTEVAEKVVKNMAFPMFLKPLIKKQIAPAPVLLQAWVMKPAWTS
jgi:2-dehydro-3-deoxyphosphooctonate aldolase (KDO 8-P synthase)